MQEQYHAIGELAGKIYKELEQRGESTLSDLQKGIGVSDSALFHQALGWLAREDKINFQKQAKTLRVSLLGMQVSS